MTEVFVYVFDLFVPTDLRRSEVLKAFEEDRLKPFEFIREIVENRVKGMKNAEFYDAIFREDGFLLEYMVDFASGRVAVKVIGSDDPREMLKQYYKHLKRQHLA